MRSAHRFRISAVATILALLVVRVTYGETLTLLQSANGIAQSGTTTNAMFNVTREQMLNVPIWSPETEPPPLAFLPALKLAKNWLTAHGDTDFELSNYAVGSVGSHWYYTFYFHSRRNAAPLNHNAAIVLMNGTVVEPVMSASVYSQHPVAATK